MFILQFGGCGHVQTNYRTCLLRCIAQLYFLREDFELSKKIVWPVIVLKQITFYSLSKTPY